MLQPNYWLAKMGLGDPDAWYYFRFGFYVAVLLAAACAVLLLAVWWFAKRRRKCREIVVAGDRGNLCVTASALRQFVARILCEFSETSLRSLSLEQKRNLLSLAIEVDIVPDAIPIALRDRIQQRVLEEVQAKLGIEDRLKMVHVTVPDWDANEAKIAKNRRKVGVEALTLPTESPLPSLSEGTPVDQPPESS